MAKHIAQVSSVRGAWLAVQGAIGGHSELFLETWPASGMTRSGSAYELPMWAPPINDSGSSSSPTSPTLPTLPTPLTTDGHTSSPGDLRRNSPSLRAIDGLLLLKTPTAQLAVNGGSQHPDKRKAGGHGPTLADEVEFLLPTPTTADGTGGHLTRGGARSNELLLPGIVKQMTPLLPTPTAMDAASSGGSNPSNVTLTDAVVRTELGAQQNPRHLPLLTTPIGDSTPPPSTAGKPPSAVLLPGPRKLDLVGANVSRRSSWNG